MKRLFLIDGMSVLFRGYFALLNAGLRSKSGEPTGATFTFISVLERLIDGERPDLIAVAWDSAGPTFRHEQYEEYKANRPEFPPEMIPQLARVKELIGYYHIPCIELPGYEADDIIGTMATRAAAEGYEVYCVTPDKDFLQLVSDTIKIYRPTKPGQPHDIVDIPGVHDRFGVRPDQVIDVLALMGDSSDNVPGVKGIGEKTAIPLIQTYGSVENLYENLESIDKAGVKKKLAEGREMAFLSKQLVTIDLNVPVDVSYEKLHRDPPDVGKLLASFDQLGFTSLMKRYDTDEARAMAKVANDALVASADGGEPVKELTASDVIDAVEDFALPASESESFDFSLDAVTTIADRPHTYILVKTLDQLDTIIDQLIGPAETLAFDLETDSTNEHIAAIIGIALSTKPEEGIYIPVASELNGRGTSEPDQSLFASDEEVEQPPLISEGLPLDDVLERLKPILESERIGKIGQNAKFDMLILRRYGIKVTPLTTDTMLAGYVIDSSQSMAMDALAERYLKYRPISITSLIGPRGKGQKTLAEVPLDVVAEYSAEDADITFALYETLDAVLKEEKLEKVAYEYEYPLVPVLTEMEYCGVKIDIASLGDISATLGNTMESLEQEIYELAGRTFTINSPKQLSEVLFTDLKLPSKKKTKTGHSTDQFVLEELALLHPLPEKILEFRQAAKLKSTYVDALPALINPRSGRIHTSYNQAVTSTGRLSSNNPNLQNIPIRSDIGREIRKAFIAGVDDGVIISADYSQIELRIMAHISGDAALVQAFTDDFDIHTATAMRVFNVAADDVEPNMRRKAKEVNFGIMYGIGPFGLARRLKIEQDEARELIKTYFAGYPGVQNYINGILQQLRESGYVETLSGRRRYFGNPDALRNPQRGMVERAAINMPIQGTASDIIKLAMINLHDELPKAFPGANMLLQVHDELVFEAPRSEAEALAAFVKEKMETAFPLGDVPLIAETGIGENWYEAH